MKAWKGVNRLEWRDDTYLLHVLWHPVLDDGVHGI
jgi:hypothetical protein